MVSWVQSVDFKWKKDFFNTTLKKFQYSWLQIPSCFSWAVLENTLNFMITLLQKGHGMFPIRFFKLTMWTASAFLPKVMAEFPRLRSYLLSLHIGRRACWNYTSPWAWNTDCSAPVLCALGSGRISLWELGTLFAWPWPWHCSRWSSLREEFVRMPLTSLSHLLLAQFGQL